MFDCVSGKMRQVRRAIFKQRALFLITVVIIVQSLSGSFVTSHAGASGVHWMTYCPVTEKHQISEVSGDHSPSPTFASRVCPDCVQTPLAGALFENIRVVAIKIDCPLFHRDYISTTAGEVCVAGPAFPPRAPPSALMIDSQRSFETASGSVGGRLINV